MQWSVFAFCFAQLRPMFNCVYLFFDLFAISNMYPDIIILAIAQCTKYSWVMYKSCLTLRSIRGGIVCPLVVVESRGNCRQHTAKTSVSSDSGLKIHQYICTQYQWHNFNINSLCQSCVYDILSEGSVLGRGVKLCAVNELFDDKGNVKV